MNNWRKCKQNLQSVSGLWLKSSINYNLRKFWRFQKKMGDGAGFVGIRFCQVSWPISTIDYFVKASLESLLSLTSNLIFYFTSKNKDTKMRAMRLWVSIVTFNGGYHSRGLNRTGSTGPMEPKNLRSKYLLEPAIRWIQC